MKFFKNLWFKLILLLFLIGGIFFGLRSLGIDFSNIKPEEIKTWVDSLGAWGPVLYIVIYILRPLILLPANITSATAGVIWGPGLGFLYLQIAANISSTLEFLIARYFARDFVSRKLKGKLLDLDKKIEKHGFLTVFLIRIIPNVAWDIQNFSLGVTKVKFRDYFFATLIGIMPLSFAVVFFGSSLIQVLTDIRNLWIMAVAIFIFLGVFYLQKYLKKKQAKDKKNSLEGQP